MNVEPHKSSLGLDANTLALLSYIAAFVLSWIPVVQYVAWVAPLIIFFLEKQSTFVKFHAMQAFLLEVVVWIFQVVIAIVTTVVWSMYMGASVYDYGALSAAAGLAGALGIVLIVVAIIVTIFAIIAMIKAYGYKEYKIPGVGALAEKWSRKNISPNSPH